MSNKKEVVQSKEVVVINKVEVLKEIADHLLTLSTTSSKIRFLDSKGITRGSISKILNKRYQHVRNVLITPVTKQK